MSAAPEITMYVCTSCAADSADLLIRFAARLKGAEVQGVECMSGCTRAQTVGFRATGKTAYLFGEITAADTEALQTFITEYAGSTDGTFADARVLGDLRTKAIARIPG